MAQVPVKPRSEFERVADQIGGQIAAVMDGTHTDKDGKIIETTRQEKG